MLWPDNETDRDFLRYQVHADLIRSVVTDLRMLPVTIGLFGDWGSGKSSVMRMLARDLDAEKHKDGCPPELEGVVVLYFNGWLFEGYDDAKAALISAVLLALGEHQTIGPKVRDKVVSLLKSVNWMRVTKLGFQKVALPTIAAYATGGASMVTETLPILGRLFNKVIPNNEPARNPPQRDEKSKEEGVDWSSLLQEYQEDASPLDIRTFRERFAKLLADANIRSLVVLIDDLDRCQPERLIENLEAIKLFLSVERTAFIIGADPRIVRHAIKVRYHTHQVEQQGDASTPQSSIIDDYLEKLVQVPYSLPKLSPSEIQSYMTLLFCSRELSETEMEKALASCLDYRRKNPYAVFGSAGVSQAIAPIPLPAPLAEALAFSDTCAPLMTEALKGNPRQVKRFLNALFMRRKLAEVASLREHVRDEVLVKLMILEYADENAFTELNSWQAAHEEGKPAELCDLEAAIRQDGKRQAKGEQSVAKVPDNLALWTKDFRRKWLMLDPPLSGVDLRDYFWVVRDRLQSAMAGISMIPPHLRRIFEDLLKPSEAHRHAGVNSAKSLPKGELDFLLSLVQKHALKDPNACLLALISMVSTGIKDAEPQITTLLNICDASRLNPGLASQLLMLFKKAPELETQLKDRLNALSQTETRFGRMLTEKRTTPSTRIRGRGRS